MKNLSKLFGIIVIAAVIIVVSGCASVSMDTFPRSHYAYTDVSLVKHGEASSTVWFGIFGTETFPSVGRVARENGITKIATVEKYVKPGFLGLSATYTTIVTGE